MSLFALRRSLGFGRKSLGLGLRRLGRGDVAGAADRARHRPGVVERDAAPTLEPVHRSVRPDDAVVDLVARLRVDCPPDHFHHFVPILRVQQRQVGVEAPVEAARLQSEHSLQPLVPCDHARCHVPSPRPQVTGVERQLKVLGQIGRALLGQAPVGHIVRGRDGPDDGPVIAPQR